MINYFSGFRKIYKGPSQKEIEEIISKQEITTVIFKAHGLPGEIEIPFNPSTDFNPDLKFPIKIESGKLIVEFSVENSDGNLYFSSEF